MTPRQYAEGVYAALVDASPSERRIRIDRFLFLLRKDGRRRDVDTILRALERLEKERSGVRSVEVLSSKKLSETELEAVLDEGKRIFGENQIALKARLRPDILGGAVFQTENETFDASMGGRLRQLSRFLKKES